MIQLAGHIEKMCTPDYYILNTLTEKIVVKDEYTDTGNTFYVYDAYNTDGAITAFNRYVNVDDLSRPFGRLLPLESSILKPPKQAEPLDPEHIV